MLTKAEHDSLYRKRHGDRIRTRRRELYILNIETKRKQAKESAKRRREKLNEYSRKYRVSSSERKLKHNRLVHKYQEEHKDELAIKAKEYTKQNPLVRKAIKHRYRARFLKAGNLTVETIQRVYETNIKKYETLTCYLCEKTILFGTDHLEHKIPLARGGTNDFENLDIACETCNKRKATKTDVEFKQQETII